jgi:malate dehydrogenase (oxaloacetate-decarboxylating)
MTDLKKAALAAHKKARGKLETGLKVSVSDQRGMSLFYTPGVAEPCREIARNPSSAYDLTSKWNTIAIVTDGSAVLGLGNIGPVAGLPVMEGKAALFKSFGGVDAVPICLDTQDVDEIVRTVKAIAPGFGGINLEDISAPRCFEIEERLINDLDIPVFHDDQHGTAVIVLAGLINALKVVGKSVDSVRIVISGAGAAGIAIGLLLSKYGFENLVLVDSKGEISSCRKDLNKYKKVFAKDSKHTQSDEGCDFIAGLKEVIVGADVFIGVSKPGVLSSEMVSTMASDPVIFAMSNPDPEISPSDAIDSGARVVATGRSDYPNQINNVLVFPGIFRGALDSRARKITDKMKLSAAEALAGLIPKPTPTKIIPDVFDKRVVEVIAKAVGDNV